MTSRGPSQPKRFYYSDSLRLRCNYKSLSQGNVTLIGNAQTTTLLCREIPVFLGFISEVSTTTYFQVHVFPEHDVVRITSNPQGLSVLSFSLKLCEPF